MRIFNFQFVWNLDKALEHVQWELQRPLPLSSLHSMPHFKKKDIKRGCDTFCWRKMRNGSLLVFIYHWFLGCPWPEQLHVIMVGRESKHVDVHPKKVCLAKLCCDLKHKDANIQRLNNTRKHVDFFNYSRKTLFFFCRHCTCQIKG